MRGYSTIRPLNCLAQMSRAMVSTRWALLASPLEEGSGALESLMLDFVGHYSQGSVDMIRVFGLRRLLSQI